MTAYFVAYGKNPSDRFIARAYRNRKTAHLATLVPAKLVPGVPKGSHAGGHAYVIESEKDVTFNGTLLVEVFNQLTGEQRKRFTSRVDGIQRLLSALKQLPVTAEAPAASEESSMPDTKSTNTAAAERVRAWKDLPDDATIHIKAEGCPRREGTAAADHWKIYKNNQTVKQFRDAGGEPGRAREDERRGNIEIRRPAVKASAAA